MQPETLEVFDLDGVVRIGQTIPLAHRDLLATLERCGHRWTIATGRGLSRVLQGLEGLQPKTPLVVCNGSVIVEPNGHTIAYHPLPEAAIALLKPVLESREVVYAVCCPEGCERYHVLAKTKAAQCSALAEMGKLVESFVDCSQQFAHLASQSRTAKITLNTQGEVKLPQRLTAKVARNGEWYDFTVNDKAAGIKILAEHLGIPLNRVHFYGDDWNDLPALTDATLGRRVAIGNDCPAQVRAAAEAWYPSLLDAFAS